MAEIIFTDTKCADCDKDLPRFSIAIVVQPDFIVCPECLERVDDEWRLMQEIEVEHPDEWPRCGGGGIGPKSAPGEAARPRG